jgi:ribosomal protein S18 acetylase RimI-like enzyme
MAPPNAGVVIRRVAPDDEPVVRALWESGFRELGPHSYARITASPVIALASAAVASALALGGAPRAALVVGALGAAVYSPLGAALHDALMGVAIAFASRRTMHDLGARWSEPGAAFFVAAEAAPPHAVVGCVGVKLSHTLAGEAAPHAAPLEGEASVWRLSVARAARGRAVGRALMAEAERWARAHGAQSVSLICGNPESVRFYKALGYRPESEACARRVLWGATDARAPWRAGGPLREAWLRTRLAPATATLYARTLT